MRFTLCLIILLSALAGPASPAEPPGKADKKPNTLKQLEGEWEITFAGVATPKGLQLLRPSSPDKPTVGLLIKDGTLLPLLNGKPSSDTPLRLELGSETQCLRVFEEPGKGPSKVRFKVEGDRLTLVRDMLFREECPESFDPEKGRDRQRWIKTYARKPPTAPKAETKQTVVKQLEGDWVLKGLTVGTPDGALIGNLPSTTKAGLRVKDEQMNMTQDGKLISKWGRIEVGSEPECLLWYGLPGQEPFKQRFRLAGDFLVIVQDNSFREDCPESFDPEKGRDRARTILILMRESKKP